ncbi:hypothetical protein SAMN04488556_2064 [Halostagnicola kamekurae]|uniref:Uncharacterized protein n=2 Tax=Halostagnicola kamekurae TaxID=619731 RepID=A0A1I6RSH2_9EURY|nr:hypothetical protein SAMN04488556_2064 [Halostagnicola kamekurae]
MCEQSTDDDTSEWANSRFRPDSLGRAFGILFVASIGSFVLSTMGLIALGWWLPADAPKFSVGDPPVLALLGSWVGMWASPLAYSSWSFWQLRGMTVERSRPRSRNPLVRGYQLLALVSADLDELTPYEKRLQLTVQSFLLGAIVLVGPTYLVVSGHGRGVTTPNG